MGINVIRVYLDGFPEVSSCLLKLLLVRECRTQIKVQMGILWLNRLKNLEESYPAGIITRPQEIHSSGYAALWLTTISPGNGNGVICDCDCAIKSKGQQIPTQHFRHRALESFRSWLPSMRRQPGHIKGVGGDDCYEGLRHG